MPHALVNCRMLLDGDFALGHALVIHGGRISAIVPEADLDPAMAREDLAGEMLVPGFIDTQVNGGGGALFNDDPSVETIRRIGAAHARFGTTGFLPTLISDDLDVVRAGIAAVDAAIAQGVPGVLGIHIEGPFISRARKGIHDAARIQAMSEEGIEVLTSLRRGKTLVTLAPECVSPDTVRRLTAKGVIVAAGHTDGSYAQVSTAIDAGLTGFTHLFNAMSQLGNREPGAVGAALESEHVWCSLIVDGFHVSPVTLKLALRCKPRERFLLVTDAMSTTGTESHDFMLQGQRISAGDGRLLSADGTLAGSSLDMMAAVRGACRLLGLPLADAVAMASHNPASFLGLSDHGRLAPGQTASFVAIDDSLRVSESWIDGIRQLG